MLRFSGASLALFKPVSISYSAVKANRSFFNKPWLMPVQTGGNDAVQRFFALFATDLFVSFAVTAFREAAFAVFFLFVGTTFNFLAEAEPALVAFDGFSRRTAFDLFAGAVLDCFEDAEVLRFSFLFALPAFRFEEVFFAGVSRRNCPARSKPRTFETVIPMTAGFSTT